MAADLHTNSITRGRPRSPAADEAILQAALSQIQDEGYARMSMESVAAAAGVSKATVYRRYRSKEALATAAVARLTDVAVAPDTGDTRVDLATLFTRLHKNLISRKRMSMIGTLLVEETRNPELMLLFRQRIIVPRRQRITKIIKRGIKDGEIRLGVDPEQVADCLIGSYFAHYLTSLPTRRSWPQEIVDLIWDGISMPAPQPNDDPKKSSRP